MVSVARKAANRILAIAPKSVQTFAKETVEILFWKRVLRESGGSFYNGHFQSRYTDLFDLDKEFYSGKRVLDVGCGPLGSLEWADNASERVGVDPLTDKYTKLNGGSQSMEYVKAGCEEMPFENSYFDIVSCFNALDHVENVEGAIKEICRVVSERGDLLLIVEIDHEPTVTEPHRISENFLNSFECFAVLSKSIFALRDDHDVYKSIRDGMPRQTPGDPAILCVHLRRDPALLTREMKSRTI